MDRPAVGGWNEAPTAQRVTTDLARGGRRAHGHVNARVVCSLPSTDSHNAAQERGHRYFELSNHRAIALQAEPRIVVDLSQVTFMDLTTLGTLVGAVKQVKARGGTLSVVGASDGIARLLHITALDTGVPLCPEPVVDARGVVVDHRET